MKKFTSMIIVAVLLLSSVGSAFAAGNEVKSDLVLTKKQQEEIKQAKMKTESLKKKWESRKGPKYHGDQKVSNGVSIQAGYYSRPGMFLVTLDTASSSSSAWAGGHAGMVYSDYYVIESWGNQGEALNGVNLWPNDWDTRYTHMELRSASDTTVSEDEQAADKAFSYAGNTPYNINFFYINQDSSFYCSQLVWYCFYNLFDIDMNDGGAVWPVDLTESSESYVVYSQ